MSHAVIEYSALNECPPNFPVPIKFWIGSVSDEMNEIIVKSIEQLLINNFHLGQEEMDISFDVYTANTGYAPINADYSNK